MHLVRHDEKNREFIVVIQNKVAALKYRVLPGRDIWDFYSTFVPPELRGHHVGEDLVVYGLNYARKHHHRIIPSCSFVKRFIDENPDYQNVVFSEII
jgi:predicted GNAT family acetyltransferase